MKSQRTPTRLEFARCSSNRHGNRQQGRREASEFTDQMQEKGQGAKGTHSPRVCLGLSGDAVPGDVGFSGPSLQGGAPAVSGGQTRAGKPPEADSQGRCTKPQERLQEEDFFLQSARRGKRGAEEQCHAGNTAGRKRGWGELLCYVPLFSRPRHINLLLKRKFCSPAHPGAWEAPGDSFLLLGCPIMPLMNSGNCSLGGGGGSQKPLIQNSQRLTQTTIPRIL